MDIELGNKDHKINHSNDTEIKNELVRYNSCMIVCTFICIFPLIVCDLYFGFTNDPCLLEHPSNLNFKLKSYLLVSGFIGIINFIIYSVSSCISIYLNAEEITQMMVICITFKICMVIFYIVWNILGAVLFWGYIYPNDKCNTELSTYLFVSLIIKLISSSSILKNKDEL
jgi:hypothetical protein